MEEEPSAGPVDALVALLELEEFDTDLYGAPSPHYTYRPNIFGGQVAAQSLRAAGLTVDPSRRAHSLHGYFLRAGRPGDPVVLYVERVRDGGSFTTRRVVARQHGEAIFITSVSFHVDEPGESRQLPLPAVPGPEEVPAPAAPDRGGVHDAAFEIRNVLPAGGWLDAPAPAGPLQPVLSMWVRARGPLPEDPSLHQSLLTYVSDMRSAMAALVGNERLEDMMMTSLDHSVWFHRPIRADDWFLVEVRPVSTSGSRGLVMGTIHDRHGVHGASFAQEALSRRRR